ncbi:glycosyltransferase [Paracoccus aminophilus]|uniref:Glycosyl transferase n=1 Tax=Paracoccus aminophilus JCM 7686 TaxID=1367847 RepID=S5XN89_PARAH|nr:glycosyltransferase [Paracoccus aminophilus]AGT08774.1 glycosyl transferase [Paracoccus aminophilus JCM 7686]
MISRILGLFRLYASRHATMQKSGFPLLDNLGKRVGHIDRITIREGRLWVEGWTLSDRVGLANSVQTVECAPNLTRDDVETQFADVRGKTPGFMLDMPLSLDHTVFWSDVGDIRYMQALPQVASRELKTMRRKQFVPFLRDTIRVFPAGVRWLLHRDPQSAARIKSALKLNTVPRSRQLNDLIFAEDVAVKDRLPGELLRTGITIVIPVYNAFDLLPEVLARVVSHTDLPWRLILIEDSSSDPQVRPWLRAWRAGLSSNVAARVTVLENDTNLGFIGSVNKAFAAALPFGNHVVLLNSDAFVPARWASRLIRPFLEHDNVATVTPMSNDAEIFNVPVICKRAHLFAGEADAIDEVAARFFPGADLADAPTGVGFCMAINIKFLRKLPELDAGFGRGYGEEVDWCQRARHLGGRHLGHGGLFVEHRGGSSFGSADKLRLVRDNSKIVSLRYPRYDAEVQEFIRQDPLNTARLALALAWAGKRQKGAVPVYLAHDMGGGAEHYLQDRLKTDLKTGASAVILRVGGLSRWQIELHSAEGITRGGTDSTDFVRRLLGLLPARRIIYSCAVGDRDAVSMPEVLISLARGPDDRIEVLVHDYLIFSPSYTLLESDGIYRGVPTSHNSDPAHTVIRDDGTIVTLNDWRKAWGTLLEAASLITVFSENSRNLVCLAYPDVAAKLTVTPHRLLHDVPPITPRKTKDGVPVIGVLGNIGYQKGITVLRDLSQELVKNRRARLVVLGNTEPAYPLAASAHIHGDYRVQDIPALVARYGITRWLIPSIWPETFSYTTHEALATGLPVFGFDLGAQGDAIRAAAAVSGRGGVIPLVESGADPDEVLDMLLNEEVQELCVS